MNLDGDVKPLNLLFSFESTMAFRVSVSAITLQVGDVLSGAGDKQLNKDGYVTCTLENCPTCVFLSHCCCQHQSVEHVELCDDQP